MRSPTGPRDAAIAGSGFALFARPIHTTPEAASEAQPLVADDLLLVYAGRTDNGRAMAIELRLPATVGDGALIMAAYRRWG